MVAILCACLITMGALVLDSICLSCIPRQNGISGNKIGTGWIIYMLLTRLASYSMGDLVFSSAAQNLLTLSLDRPRRSRK